MPHPETIHITNPMDYRYNWIIYYTNALFHVGEVQEALTWTQRALEICPDDAWHRENFFFFTHMRQMAQETKFPVRPVMLYTEQPAAEVYSYEQATS